MFWWLFTVFFEPFLSNLKLNVQVGFHKGNFFFSCIKCVKFLWTSPIFIPHPDTHTPLVQRCSHSHHFIPHFCFISCTHFVVFCPDCYFFTFSCSASRSQSQLEVTVWVSALNNALVLVWFCMQNCIVYDTKGLTFCRPIHYFS